MPARYKFRNRLDLDIFVVLKDIPEEFNGIFPRVCQGNRVTFFAGDLQESFPLDLNLMRVVLVVQEHVPAQRRKPSCLCGVVTDGS